MTDGLLSRMEHLLPQLATFASGMNQQVPSAPPQMPPGQGGFGNLC